MKPLIIGVDPGSTSAVSAIDFEGEKVFTESRKNFPPRDIISETVKKGRPVVVTSDKAKFPSTVDKIARSLGAYRYELEKDLSKERKQELGEGDNSHELDASASARNAYRGLRDRIETLKDLASDKDVEIDEIAVQYFRDDLGPLDQIEMDDGQKEKDRSVKMDSSEDVLEEGSSDRVDSLVTENERLETKISNLEDQIEGLEEELDETREERDRWRSKYDRMRTEKRKEIMKERLLSKKNAEIKEKDEEISELDEKLEKASIREKQYQKALELIEDGGKVFRLYEKGGKDGEVFFTRSDDIEELLKEKGEEVFHVDDVDCVELFDRIVLEERPRKDVREVLEEYRDGR